MYEEKTFHEDKWGWGELSLLFRETFEAKLRNGLSVRISEVRPDASQCDKSEV